MRIFIVGPMASGKSTIGKRLAQKLNLLFIDIDKEIEDRAGTDIPWIFEVEGEKGFRKREERVLEESIKKSNVVISTGAGIVLSKSNRDVMGLQSKYLMGYPLRLVCKHSHIVRFYVLINPLSIHYKSLINQ